MEDHPGWSGHSLLARWVREHWGPGTRSSSGSWQAPKLGTPEARTGNLETEPGRARHPLETDWHRKVWDSSSPVSAWLSGKPELRLQSRGGEVRTRPLWGCFGR